MRSGKTLYQSRVAERIWEDEHQFSVLDSSQKKGKQKNRDKQFPSAGQHQERVEVKCTGFHMPGREEISSPRQLNFC